MLEGRIAAAPISWGVCEVPGWGLMLSTSRVLPEMVSVGHSATQETENLWCLDAGHLAIGGTNPVAIASQNADRVGHVRLKSVNMSSAGKVLTREISLLKAVQKGIFVPFGKGDVNITDVVLNLEAGGYSGRYVLEQDMAIMGQEPAEGEGPLEDVRTCLSYLAREVEPKLATTSV